MNMIELAKQDVELHENMTGLAQSLLDDRARMSAALLEVHELIEDIKHTLDAGRCIEPISGFHMDLKGILNRLNGVVK